jgi:RND family efflux transporter MFP subunit
VSKGGEAPVRLIKVAARVDNSPPPVLTATGKIVSDHRVQVSTKVSGQVTALYFEQGDKVKNGQVLAHIEDVIYRARRDEAAARLKKSNANLAFQKFNYARIKALFDQKSAPETEFNDARRALHEAESQVAMDQASLDWAQKMLTDCEVVAPISGVVLERSVEVGDFVAAEGGRGAMANSQFATIADMSVLRVEVDVSELDISRIRKDMPCQISPEAYKDRKYRGHVMWLDPGANYSKATVQVKVRIDDPDDYLRVEGSAQVVFLTEAPSSAPAASQPASIWVPASAVQVKEGGREGTVFRAVDGRLRAANVTVGRQSGGQVEVLSGISEGDSIAAENVSSLRDDMKISQ